jgi:hypothetical protein
MTNCLVTKRTIAQGGIYDYTAATEDLIQVEGANNVVLDRITFGEMTTTTGENGLDVKTLRGTNPALLVKRSWVKGPFNGLSEGTNNNAVLQAANDNVTVEDCRVSHGNVVIGTDAVSSATLRRIRVDSGASIVLQVCGDAPRTHGPQLFNISMVGGLLKFGTGTAGDQPHNVELSGSSFTGTDIVKNTGTTFAVCTGNTYTSCTGVVPPCT